MANIAYVLLKNPTAVSGPPASGQVQVEFCILGPGNTIVSSGGTTAVDFNYGDSDETIQNSVVAQMQILQSDPYLIVQFL